MQCAWPPNQTVPRAAIRRRAVRRRAAVWVAAATLTGCQTTARLPTEDATSVLAEARQRLADEDPTGAEALLRSYDSAQFPPAQQPQYEVLRAEACLGIDAPWDAFETLRGFGDAHPHSDLREQAVDLEFRAGNALAHSDRGFLFFWSDRRGAKTCLEHLITRYPNNRHAPDALRLLGELAFADGDFELAEDRFRELLRRHADSEWAPLARFRFAMSIVASLRGPDYDLARMESATKELRAFLDHPPENPGFVREAAQALARLLDWRATRHLQIADFYRVVGNAPGERLHLRAASAEEFRGTAAGAAATARLEALGPAATDPNPRGGPP